MAGSPEKSKYGAESAENGDKESETKSVNSSSVGTETKAVIGDNAGTKTWSATGHNVGTETINVIGDNVEIETRNVIGDNVGTETKNVIRDNVGTETTNVIGNNLRTETCTVIGDNVGAETTSAIGDNVATETPGANGCRTKIEVDSENNHITPSNHAPLSGIIPASLLVDCPFSIMRLFRESAVGLTEAETAKQNHQHEEALTLYRKHLHGLIQTLKYHNSKINEVPGLKKAITEKAHEHLTNAEECKREVEQQRGKIPGGRRQRSREDLEARVSNVSESPEELGITVVQHVPGLFEEVCGLNKAKDILKEFVILPMKFPFMIRYNYRSFILMFGAPGTGKTLLARSLASVLSEGQVLLVQCSDFYSRYLPNKEQRLKQIFEFTERQGPCVLILDEIECLISTSRDTEQLRSLRTEVFSQVCTGNRRNSSMYIIGLTNRPMMLDATLLRMVTKFIYISLPDKDARMMLLRQQIKSCPHAVTDQQLEALSRCTEGYSGSDLQVLIRDVLMTPVREIASASRFKQQDNGKYVPCSIDDPQAKEINIYELDSDWLYLRPVLYSDFLHCLEKVKPSVSAQDVQEHQDFIERYSLQDYLYDQVIPASPPTLKNLCKYFILKHTKRGELSELPLPQRLITFLSPQY